MSAVPGLAVVKFFAPWCGTCKAIHAPYNRLAQKKSEEHPDRIKFFQCNFNDHKKLCYGERVVALPTVHIYLQGIGLVHKSVLVAKDSMTPLQVEIDRFLTPQADGELARLEQLQGLDQGGRAALVRFADMTRLLQALKAAPALLQPDVEVVDKFDELRYEALFADAVWRKDLERCHVPPHAHHTTHVCCSSGG